MLKWMRKQLNQAQKGFTLIELLIVVAIIGIAFGGLRAVFNAEW